MGIDIREVAKELEVLIVTKYPRGWEIHNT